MIDVRLVQEPVDLAKLLDRVSDPDCGAAVLFTGSTRRWTGEQYTSKLAYEAHESMAMRSLNQLATMAQEKWNIKHVAIVHRLGEVGVGEISVAIAVSSLHREDSFQAAKWLIDTLKQDVPIWKREFDQDQVGQWIHPDERPTA